MLLVSRKSGTKLHINPQKITLYCTNISNYRNVNKQFHGFTTVLRCLALSKKIISGSIARATPPPHAYRPVLNTRYAKLLF